MTPVERLATCDEAVYRNDQSEPCEKPAVAMRRDPEYDTPYPVCYRHARSSSLMVPLPELIAEAQRSGKEQGWDECVEVTCGSGRGQLGKSGGRSLNPYRSPQPSPDAA